MTERAISYLLLLAATVAVLLVVVIQPRNTLIQKQRMMQGVNPNLAQTCTTGDMTCDAYRAWMCESQQGGTWNSNTQSCTPPATTCNGSGCTAETCQAMANMGGGYSWNAETQTCNITSGSGSSGSVAAIGGISANERLAQRIESQCLAHVEKSGYGETVRKYGWYNNIRTYANNACTLAYIAAAGKFGNPDLYLILNLLTNDVAVRQEDIGMLYQALEDVPSLKDFIAQGKGESLDDYLNPAKDGAAGRLKAIMDIMVAYNDLTTDQKVSPTWLAEPMPHTTKDAAATWNAQHGTKIVSLEEKLLALLPQPEIEKVAITEEPTPEIKKEVPVEPTPVQQAAAEEKINPSQQKEAVRLLTKIKNLFKEIRDAVIARTTIQPDPETQLQDAFRIQEIKNAFDACLENGVCSEN